MTDATVADLMHSVCVIGAGSSGIAACQALHSRGIAFDCFEAGSTVGGNWRYNNDSGMSCLYFIGLVQPVGAIMPIAEIQSQWVADLLEGRAALPPVPEMNREITRYRTATARRYGRPGRHAIQVDFLPYLQEIRKERAAGARRRARRALAADQISGSTGQVTPWPGWRSGRWSRAVPG